VVRAERLRPAGAPALLGTSHLLAGYRLFVRHRGADGRRRRGLHILRSSADRAGMVAGGNLLTHYRYRRAALRCEERDGLLEVAVRTPAGDADLDAVADLANAPGPLPAGSPFASVADARRFAGPLPRTFDYEPETRSVVMVRGRRSHWEPRSVAVTVRACGFLAHGPWPAAPPCWPMPSTPPASTTAGSAACASPWGGRDRRGARLQLAEVPGRGRDRRGRAGARLLDRSTRAGRRRGRGPRRRLAARRLPVRDLVGLRPLGPGRLGLAGGLAAGQPAACCC
jgi:hypothetical protein